MFYLTIVNKIYVTVTLGWHGSTRTVFQYNIITLVNVYVNLLVFMRITGTS